MLVAVLSLILPRHCHVCGRRTRRWEPLCALHHGEPERPGDLNP